MIMKILSACWQPLALIEEPDPFSTGTQQNRSDSQAPTEKTVSAAPLPPLSKRGMKT
jgi:hypothetical protein